MKELEIFKGNELIQAKPTKHLTAREKKLVSYMIAQINPYDDDYKEYSFPISDFAKFFNITDKNVNKEYEKIAKGIIGKPFSVDTDDETFVASWLAQAVYVKETKEIKWSYPPILKPYLIRLKRYYTKYRMINLVHLDNCHSESLYELLKQHEKLGQRDFTIEELRDFLALQKKYPAYANLKAKVIAPAVEEINKYTDINCSYTEHKQGRKISILKFKIWPDPNNKYIQDALASEKSDNDEALTISVNKAESYNVPETVPEEYREAVQELVEGFGIVIEDALPLAHRYGSEYILKILTVVEQRIADSINKGQPINNIGAYTKRIIADSYQQETGVERRIREKATAQEESKAMYSLKVIEDYLEKLYAAWYKTQLRSYAELSVGMYSDEFKAYLSALDDLFAETTRDAVKRNGVDLSDSFTYTTFCNFLHSEKAVEGMFSKERFMEEENYSVDRGPEGAILYKNGHSLDI